MENQNNQLSKKKPITAERLHHIVDDVIYGLRDETIDVGVAREIINAAGKKVQLTKLQMEYATMWGGKVDIPFLSAGDDDADEQ